MFDFQQGKNPLLISFPHSGTWLPAALAERMTEPARRLPDTDWFVPELYDVPSARQASRIQAGFSRFLIDLNRPPDGTNLYPGQPTPELCPRQCFDGSEIYAAGRSLQEDEIPPRRAEFWEPYHHRLARELERIREVHGLAVLVDAHSIRSRVPRLFDGELPHVNVGTARGTSCDRSLEDTIISRLSTSPYTHVLNGRFVGGYITRHYGRPRQRIHAVQIELAQRAYMDETRHAPDAALAARFQETLHGLLQAVLQWAKEFAG